MSTLATLALQVAQVVQSVLQGAASSGTAASLTDIDRITDPNGTYNDGTLWFLTGTLAGKMVAVKTQVNNTVNFETQSAAPCVQQAVNALVNGAVTLSGNAAVTVTAAGMLGGGKALAVAVLNGDSASVVAGKVRVALAADVDVSAFFDVGGTGANVALTAKRAAANDGTMGVTVNNGTCAGLSISTASSLATGLPATYALAQSDYPLNQIISAINQALQSCTITLENATLTGDGSALEFTLPAGVADVVEVLLEHSGDTAARYLSHHWHELNGKLRFDHYYEPASGDKLHVKYRTTHTNLILYSDTVDDEINEEWLLQESAFDLLMWGKKQYGDDEDYDIVTGLQVITERKKTLSKYKHSVVMVQSAGAPD